MQPTAVPESVAFGINRFVEFPSRDGFQILLDMTVEFELLEDRIRVVATARTTGPTGVEMEALTAASVALLTLYDMAKALDRAMVIDGVRLLAKSGGRSGDWRAAP